MNQYATAAERVAYAKANGIKGSLVKTFRNGEELREYIIDGHSFKIRALPSMHA